MNTVWQQRKLPQRGAALVVTLIVLVVLAAIAVAFMQNTGLDRAGSRSAANVYRARLAAESGLAEAMGLIQQNVNNFAYTTGSKPEGDGYRTFIRPLKKSARGTWEFDGAAVNLDSGVGGKEEVGLVLTGTQTEPGLEQKVSWKTLTSAPGDNGPTARYAFWADEGGAKQNLAWWGGSPAPAEGNSLTNLAQLTPFLPDKTGSSASPFPESALKSIVEQRKLTPTNFTLAATEFDSFAGQSALPTVATVNLLDSALEGRVNSYFFTLNSASGAASPAGTPKLNLAALTKHVNGLNSDQGAGSPKAELVEDLLKEKPENADEWGGGSLRWLADSGKYSEAEQKQIVANIIDYLDDDLIPTTDSVDSPSYFGVEFKLSEEGEVRGHPFINFVGLGSVFNWKTRDPEKGRLNSTRVLTFLGLVNPWSSAIPTSLDTYTPEIIIDIEGTVTGGSLGESAAAYFETQVKDSLDPQTQELEPRTGATFPGPASGNNYANVKSFFEAGAPEKPGIQFSELEYKVRSIKLRFTSDDGLEGYVQILSGLSTRMSPELVAFKEKTPDVYKLTRDSPEQEDLHLNGDPRLNFKKSSWISSKSSGGDSSEIPTPEADLNIFSAAEDAWDKAQGLPSGSAWYESEAVKNHFDRASESGMSSIGELGYIWTGKPWQTLNVYKTDNPQTADWNLLDYVSAGRMAGNKGEDSIDDKGTAVTTLPLAAPFGTDFPPDKALSAGLIAQGGFNVNTRKRATVEAVLDSAEGVSDEAAEAVLAKDSGSQPSAFGEIAALASDLVEGQNKFEREAAQRALANTAVNHSRVFTVYSVGEYRQGNSSSRVQLEADIFVGADPETGDPLVQVINKRFL